eukprot:TRINITY_DN666_c0_g1_i1.p1 TRINITY_DN666_c0_g1~~TRINITY_DN666_c0_g1_i1.p1  ORF type:complete len:231 (-),score=60.30 TRINITY_DN666_c0_g1_i1:336-1028(-)
MALAGAIKVATSGSAAFALSQDSSLSNKWEQCQQHRAVCMGAKPSTANLLSNSIAGEKAALSATRVAAPARRTRRDVCRAVAAQDVKSAESETATGDKVKYSFVVANAKFMLWEEEDFVELMKERLRYYEEQNRELDFWLVYEPEFLEDLPDITKRLGRPAVALVSRDATWITFMKLRLDRVLKGEFEASANAAEALKGEAPKADFKRPEPWTAPYSKYEDKWWEPFLPK